MKEIPRSSYHWRTSNAPLHRTVTPRVGAMIPAGAQFRRRQCKCQSVVPSFEVRVGNLEAGVSGRTGLLDLRRIGWTPLHDRSFGEPNAPDSPVIAAVLASPLVEPVKSDDSHSSDPPTFTTAKAGLLWLTRRPEYSVRSAQLAGRSALRSPQGAGSGRARRGNSRDPRCTAKSMARAGDTLGSESGGSGRSLSWRACS